MTKWRAVNDMSGRADSRTRHSGISTRLMKDILRGF